MARPRKRWRESRGRKGQAVAIYEPRLGSDLRWDYRDADGQRRRPWVDPPMKVRHRATDPVDPMLARAAADECERFYHELRGETHRKRQTAHDLTVGEAFAHYHDPRDGALPKSRSAQTHHKASRDYWTDRLGADRLWNDVVPANIEGAVREMVAEGKAPTAEKRFQNLRTVANWLRVKMRLRGLEDPTLGVEVGEMVAGHEPRRPRYTPKEVERLVEASVAFGPRVHLFVALLADSGARAGQVRLAMRSGLDAPLDPPPPDGVGPHGWLILPAVKRQRPMLTLLTQRCRDAVGVALESYLAPWEAEHQSAERLDYPLLPGGHVDRLEDEPISDTALRKLWPKIEAAAKVPTKPRRTFHGVRRMWADAVREGAGIDATAHAGGWSSREMVESVYVSPRRWDDLEAARKVREAK
jgi:integrase